MNEGSDMPPWWPFDDNRPRRFDLRTRTWTLLETLAKVDPTAYERYLKEDEEALESAQRQLDEWITRLERMLEKYYDVIDRGRPELDVDAFLYLIATEALDQWWRHEEHLLSNRALMSPYRAYEKRIIENLDRSLLDQCHVIAYPDGFSIENIPLVFLNTVHDSEDFCEFRTALVSKYQIWSRLIHRCKQTSISGQKPFRWQNLYCGLPAFDEGSLEVIMQWKNESSHGNLLQYVPQLGMLEQVLNEHHFVKKGPARLHFTVKWVNTPLDEPTVTVTFKGKGRA